ncbi:MAG: hypothetical protein KUG78_18485 [Kangiellaceae bacterium]|nr:hypothetical protein [Kangiellaceae bacterium]
MISNEAKKAILPLILVLNMICSLSSSADTDSESKAISRELVQSFLDTSANISNLTGQFPELQNFSGGNQLGNSAELVEFLQKSAAFPDIKAILVRSQFTSLFELFSFSQRMMAMKLHLQLKSSEVASIFQTVKILKANLNSMKANHASEEIIAKAEALVEEQSKKADNLQQVIDTLVPSDQSFVEQNEDWFIAILNR